MAIVRPPALSGLSAGAELGCGLDGLCAPLESSDPPRVNVGLCMRSGEASEPGLGEACDGGCRDGLSCLEGPVSQHRLRLHQHLRSVSLGELRFRLGLRAHLRRAAVLSGLRLLLADCERSARRGTKSAALPATPAGPERLASSAALPTEALAASPGAIPWPMGAAGRMGAFRSRPKTRPTAAWEAAWTCRLEPSG